MKRKSTERNFVRLRQDSGQHRRILGVMLLLGILAFLPIGLRLYMLMVRDYERYADLALRNQTRTTKITGERGLIYDRNMNVLASSEDVESVYLDPHELKQSRADLEKVGNALGEILDLEPSWITEQGKDYTKRYKRIASSVDEGTACKIRDFINENSISGIHLEPGTKRYYPYGTLACQVIGFANASNTGCEGVEAAYNSYLEGKTGKVVTTKGNNEMDMPFSYEKYISSQKGCSVVTTLDATVQVCLEKQMQAAIGRYDVQNGAFGLVMDVTTGEVLAMATLEGYDPNHYLQIRDPGVAAQLEQMRLNYLLHPEGSEAFDEGKKAYQEAVSSARLKQWRNRCISDGYEPGSTFKTITMASALEAGVIDLNTRFHCGGSEQIPGRSQRLHCWRAAGHGSENTAQALQNSCNIAFAHIALKLGGEQFYSYMQKFGIMEKTGIDLAGESKGVYFDKSLIVDTDKWGTASLTSGSFGQTFKVTPLQLVRAISAVVNGGKLLEPYIVSEVLDEDGNTVLFQEPTVIRQVISEKTSKIMCGLMESVVTEGTAKNAQVAGYSIGGKTGTSEKIDIFDENGQRVQDKIVSFVGVAPMDNPRYIVLVALDTPSRSTGIHISGGVMGAPTVGAVFSDILPYLGVAHNYGPEDAAGHLVTLDNYTGLSGTDAGKALQELGLGYRVIGTEELVTGQIPAPGSSVPGDSEVILYFGEEPEDEPVEVPDFTGMNRQMAAQAAGKLGLYVLVSGNTTIDPAVTVTVQKIPAGKKVPRGSTIELIFTDTRPSD